MTSILIDKSKGFIYEQLYNHFKNEILNGNKKIYWTSFNLLKIFLFVILSQQKPLFLRVIDDFGSGIRAEHSGTKRYKQAGDASAGFVT